MLLTKIYARIWLIIRPFGRIWSALLMWAAKLNSEPRDSPLFSYPLLSKYLAHAQQPGCLLLDIQERENSDRAPAVGRINIGLLLLAMHNSWLCMHCLCEI